MLIVLRDASNKRARFSRLRVSCTWWRVNSRVTAPPVSLILLLVPD